MNRPILENWSVVCITVSPYQAPETATQRLHGLVSNDARFPDNHRITTTTIVGKRDGRVVTRSGAEYLLGQVDPEYEMVYSDARTRLLASLPELPL